MVIKNNKTPQSSMNGVDVARLKSTVEAIDAVPLLARFTFRASNRWIRGGLNRSTIGSFHGAGAENHREAFVIDNAEPFLILGGDEAPSPVEYLLHALVGCLTTTLVYQASMDGVQIRSLESEVEAQLDLRGFLGLRDELPGGFENVTVRLRVQADCPPAKLAELCGLAQRRSPVTNFMSRAVPTSVVCEPL
jgi:uncharacterized OsmC-like protein